MTTQENPPETLEAPLAAPVAAVEEESASSAPAQEGTESQQPEMVSRTELEAEQQRRRTAEGRMKASEGQAATMQVLTDKIDMIGKQVALQSEYQRTGDDEKLTSGIAQLNTEAQVRQQVSLFDQAKGEIEKDVWADLGVVSTNDAPLINPQEHPLFEDFRKEWWAAIDAKSIVGLEKAARRARSVTRGVRDEEVVTQQQAAIEDRRQAFESAGINDLDTGRSGPVAGSQNINRDNIDKEYMEGNVTENAYRAFRKTGQLP